MNEYGQLIFYKDEAGEIKIDARLYDGNIWLTQKQMIDLFDSSKSMISEHINNILNEKELNETDVVKKFPVKADNNRTYNILHYNLEMIIGVGYRVKSPIGTRFRQWANSILKEHMTKGYTLDSEALKRAGGGAYFKELLQKIRDIRSSEKVFWLQVLDIYATAVDYDPKSLITRELFKSIQNRMYWATHGHTAAELIYKRVDYKKSNLGMTNYLGEIPTLKEAMVAKNYLNEAELNVLNRLVSMYLDFAELQALEENPMMMKDWIRELDYFLKMNRKDLLSHKGTISHKEMEDKVRGE